MRVRSAPDGEVDASAVETAIVQGLASDPDAGWKVENAAIDETSVTFERVQLKAHTLIALVRTSRELIRLTCWKPASTGS